MTAGVHPLSGSMPVAGLPPRDTRRPIPSEQLRRIATALSLPLAPDKDDVITDCFTKAYQLFREKNWSVIDPISSDLSLLTDRVGHTLLTHSINERHLETVRDLIIRNIGVRDEDSLGRAPLDYLGERFEEPDLSAMTRLIRKSSFVCSTPTPPPEDSTAVGAGEGVAISAAVAASTREGVSYAWPTGANLRIRFLNGAPDLIDQILRIANIWTTYANITFQRVDAGYAEIRVQLDDSGVSSSVVGAAAHFVPQQKHTMRFGWLTPATDRKDMRRTVLHEFGHALGLCHEHQSPSAGVEWDKEAVYAYYRDRLLPPSGRWKSEAEYRAHVDAQVTAIEPSTNYTAFDPHSIMLYEFPPELTKNLRGTRRNSKLSLIDKTFIARLYPGRPYLRFGLQTATCLHLTDPTFQFLMAPNRDVVAIKKQNTGSGRTEVHVLSAERGYRRFSLSTKTCLGPTDPTFEFLMAPNRDIVAIKKQNTESGSTEVHVLSAESGYRRFSLQTKTCLLPTDHTFQFLMAPNRDIVAIKKQNTDTKMTEVHVLSAAHNYQQWSLQAPTCLHPTDHTFEFLIAPNRDVVAVKKGPTGSGFTEVHSMCVE